MVRRFNVLSKNSDLFLFGPRGTGKSTLARTLFEKETVLWIDLLTEEHEERFGRHPDELSRQLAGKTYQYVVIDEIQKFPKLLDIVHVEIEKKPLDAPPYFILTGSSARKLKRSMANLLAGRVFTFFLFPFSYVELAPEFDLIHALQFGTLPLVWMRKENQKKEEYLRSYLRTYLREEILMEQLVRKTESFHDFLEIAAQMNGEILNYKKIAEDVGISDNTVNTFFEILEDTLIGFKLHPFHRSIRKRQRGAPKFYFFDCGVKRALDRTLSVPLAKGSSSFGKAFEHWVILEIFRMIEYLKNDFRISYLRTKDDAEVDLIVERPGRTDLLVEIKSGTLVTERDASGLQRFLNSWDRPAEGQIWSLDHAEKKIGQALCLPWDLGLRRLFDIK